VVAIYSPCSPDAYSSSQWAQEKQHWAAFLQAYRQQDWDQCDMHMARLHREPDLAQERPHETLYQLYTKRVASMRQLPFDASWDGASNIETK